MRNNYNYDRFGVGNYKRHNTYVKGDCYFTKTFYTEKHAQNYLAAVKRNAYRNCFAKLTTNDNGTYTLKLYKAVYWEE